MYYPDTASSILSLLLVADIRNTRSKSYPGTKLAHPLELISDQAWHGAVSMQHTAVRVLGFRHMFHIYYPVRSHGFWPLCWELLSISCLVDF